MTSLEVWEGECPGAILNQREMKVKRQMFPPFIPQADHFKTHFIKRFIKCSEINLQFLRVTVNLMMHLDFSSLSSRFPLPFLTLTLWMQSPFSGSAFLDTHAKTAATQILYITKFQNVFWKPGQASVRQAANSMCGPTLTYKSTTISKNLTFGGLEWGKMEG